MPDQRLQGAVSETLRTKLQRGIAVVREDRDCKEKLPVEILRPGDRIELIAALSFDTGTTFRPVWRWTEEDGQIAERNEKVSLQSGY